MKNRMIANHKKNSRKGSSMIEFCLCMTLLLPLLFGSMTIGMNLGRSIQVSQVVRDAGHMYARSTDFSLAGSKALIAHLARTLGMTANGGDGVIILTKVLKVGNSECTAGGVPVQNCSNNGQAVATQRILIGNATFGTSSFVTPAANLVLSSGDIVPDNYLKSLSVVTQGLTNLLVMSAGDEAYVVEGWFRSTNLTGAANGGKIYARAIF